MQTWTIENQSSTHYITILCCTPSEDFTVHGYLSNIPLWKSVVQVFESFYWWPRPHLRQPLASAGPLWMNWRMEAAIYLEASAGSEVLREEKWSNSYDWPASLKCKSQLGVAQTLPVTDGLSPSPWTHAPIVMKMTILLSYLHFWA